MAQPATTIPATERPAATAPARRLVLVTGPSGAGRSTAIRALEDLDYETIDNLPLSLIPRLFDGPPHGRSLALALGVDTRNREFSVQGFLDFLDGPLGRARAEVFYVDCRPDILLRRYSETRRRHPMAPAESPEDGIARELDLLAPIRERAEVLIDTSELSQHDLRAEIDRWFSYATAVRMALSVHSFSYKRGLPRGLDMVFDCRFLRNPYWDDTLRTGDGRDKDVISYIAADARYSEFLNKVTDLTELLLPAHVDEGKSHLTIGFGCTGGQHRSVCVAEAIVNRLAAANWQVSIRHRELERRRGGADGQASGLRV
ncbi:RNase adapter RapZ [Actibacterium sp. 188UL27-1]|uniref:RNase adapter RapZ n=1 Tax=Actibacterium sp. 188UL27-1 TaxID=2786961 RepID=UPI00195D76F6|nr:RNase adapter RapZ [Actibacterium sp. 188UL27-1]MBM7070122.1 RNase adapter RapZ [Actibacterium sp. 188UL27-1]